MNPIKKTIELADGRKITLETGKLAKQADVSQACLTGRTCHQPYSSLANSLFSLILQRIEDAV